MLHKWDSNDNHIEIYNDNKRLKPNDATTNTMR